MTRVPAMPIKPALHLLGFRFPMPKNKAPRTHPQGLATAVLSTGTTLDAALFTRWQVGVEATTADRGSGPDQSQLLPSPDERDGATHTFFAPSVGLISAESAIQRNESAN
jgi:hypothetical protein